MRALILMLGMANADLYLHNPGGSNDRNRERNENRANGNRLFDSQNNNKGGYPWRGDREKQAAPDPVEYYEGSNLLMEWTVQHSCGPNPSSHCDVIVEYACEDTLSNGPGPKAAQQKLRDGYPTGGTTNADENNDDYDPPYLRAQFDDNNKDGTNTISQATAENVEYGQHEPYAWYTEQCTQRERNKGLFAADRILNKNDARSTRQNPNGNRNGAECPEERDYFPYWAPTPFRAAAVLTSNAAWCDYLTEHTSNTEDKWMCVMPDRRNRARELGGVQTAISAAPCTDAGGTWTNTGNYGTSAPACTLHAASRQNHLGNADPTPGMDSTYDTKDIGGGTAASFNFVVPSLASLESGSTMSDVSKCESDDSCLCLLRVRYNISTNDYNSMGAYLNEEFADQSLNCPAVQQGDKNGNAADDNTAAANGDAQCKNTLENGNRPLYNRPYVQAFNADLPKLSIALNTDQSGRTFQDRTHLWRLVKRPGDAGSGTIWNVNTRGRRGNIVQAYPAVEYGFFPAEMNVNQGDMIHFQFHGSDFNAKRNPNNAEGWQYSDRTNLVQTEDSNHQFPLDWDTYDGETFFDSYAQAVEFALLDSEANLKEKGAQCEEFEAGDDNENNDPRNCGKLNYASARWQPTANTRGDGQTGLFAINHPRTKYSFVSTRNNNFSNRSNKWMVKVSGLMGWEKALIGTGIAVGVVFPIAIFLFYILYIKKMGFQDGIMMYLCCCFAGAAVTKRSGGKKKKKSKSKSNKKSLQMGTEYAVDEVNQA